MSLLWTTVYTAVIYFTPEDKPSSLTLPINKYWKIESISCKCNLKESGQFAVNLIYYRTITKQLKQNRSSIQGKYGQVYCNIIDWQLSLCSIYVLGFLIYYI